MTTILYTNGIPNGYDWVYEWTKPSSETIKRIQSRFVWATIPTANEHAIVAYTQGEQANTSNSPNHYPRSQLFSHGMGAFVMQGKGLGIEVWGPAGNALWWTQVEPSSGGATLPVISLEQALNNPPAAYITTGPTNIQDNKYYWVRVTLTRLHNGYIDILAELFIDTSIVQKAKIGVVESSWTIAGYTEMRGTVARAGGCCTIQSDAFSYF